MQGTKVSKVRSPSQNLKWPIACGVPVVLARCTFHSDITVTSPPFILQTPTPTFDRFRSNITDYRYPSKRTHTAPTTTTSNPLENMPGPWNDATDRQLLLTIIHLSAPQLPKWYVRGPAS